MFARGQYDLAIENFKLAVQASPKFIQSHLNLVQAYFMNEQLDESLASVEKVLELNPENVEAQLILAQIWMYQGKFETLRSIYKNCYKRGK